MKRAFSLQDLGNAILHSDSSTVAPSLASPVWDLQGSTAGPRALSTMRRSKSMNAIDADSDEETCGSLPSILTLGMANQSLRQVHGLEVLKRSAQGGLGGGMTSMPRSLSNSSLSQLVIQDDDIGAASALMELSAVTVSVENKTVVRVVSAPNAPAVLLPSLRELLGGPGDASNANSPVRRKIGMSQPSMYNQNQGNTVWDERSAAMLGVQMQAYQQLAVATQSQSDIVSHRAAGNVPSPAVRSLHGIGEDGEVDGKHNKYCHFCQHVKVKRATSMLACENTECARRFCEHCLKTHLSNVTPSDGMGINDLVDGKWLCPICRKFCCCAIQSCENKHRHCKAYRYRQRRAEQAAKRTMATETSRNKPIVAAMHSTEGHMFTNPQAAAQAAQYAHQWVGFGAHSACYPGTQVSGAHPQIELEGILQGIPLHMAHMAASSVPMLMPHSMQSMAPIQMQMPGARPLGMVGGFPFEFHGQPAGGGDGGSNALHATSTSAVAAGPQGLAPLGMPSGPSYLHFH